jgi:hypothetical protein
MSGELADPPVEPLEPPEKPFSRNSGDGYNVEAGRRIRAGDRAGLERICRYIVRPPFCQERLRLLDDGRVVYKFRRPWPDGSTHLVLDPVELLGKLAALIPPPRSHLLRYHGVLAPNARRRKSVIPAAGRVPLLGGACHSGGPPPCASKDFPAEGLDCLAFRGWGPETQGNRLSSDARPAEGAAARSPSQAGGTIVHESRRLGKGSDCSPSPCTSGGLPESGETSLRQNPKPSAGKSSPDRVEGAAIVTCTPDLVVETASRQRWRQRMRRADLLKRTMGLDVLACPRCGGRLEPIAEILEPGAVAKILRSMGLPASPPRVSPARPPPQSNLELAQ